MTLLRCSPQPDRGFAPVLFRRVGVLALLLACSACRSSRPTVQVQAGEDPLDELQMLIGDWVSDSVGTLPSGEAFDSRVETDARWTLQGHFVRSDSRYWFSNGAGEDAPDLESTSLFTWDAANGIYRFWSFDGQGNCASGSMVYDPKTQVWTMRQQGVDRKTGAPALGEGHMRYLNEGEKALDWKSLSPSGEDVLLTVEGTSRRVD